jgi:hypothetical protein
MYTSFHGLKNQILAHNRNVLAFGFTEKCYFVIKTDQNFVFLDREAHILDPLYIIVLCISFKKGFQKISNFD